MRERRLVALLALVFLTGRATADWSALDFIAAALVAATPYVWHELRNA